MPDDYSSQVGLLVARAFTTGVETSIVDLAELLDIDESSRLAAAARVMAFVTSFQLELVPGPDSGEYDTARVLRSAALATDPSSRVASLMSRGEGHEAEFKASLLCSMRDWAQKGTLVEHPSLEGEVLKTLCAFINTDGGDLLVGVTDDGECSGGVELDIKLKGWNLDKWQLHVHSLIRERFYEGDRVVPYVRARMVVLKGAQVFHVNVTPRGERSFVRRQKALAYEYFVRNGPRTDSLDLPTFYAQLIGSPDRPG